MTEQDFQSATAWMFDRGVATAENCSQSNNPTSVQVPFTWLPGRPSNNKNSSGDEIANVLVNDDIAHT